MNRFVLVRLNRIRMLGLLALYIVAGLGGFHAMRYSSGALVALLGPTVRDVIAGVALLLLIGILFFLLPAVLMRFEMITVYDGKRVRAYRRPYHFWFPSRRREAIPELDLRQAEFTTVTGAHGALQFVIRTSDHEIVAPGAEWFTVPDWEERWERLQESLRAGDSTEGEGCFR